MRKRTALPAALLAAALAFTGGAASAADPAAPDVQLETLDLRDVPLADACRLVAGRTGLNLVPSAEAGKRKVSIFLRDVPAAAAIDALCKAHQLWVRRDEATGILRIHTLEEYRLDLSAVEDEKTESFTLLHPNATEAGNAIRDLFGARVVLRMDTGSRDVSDDLEDRFERFDIVDERTQDLGTGFSSGLGTTNGTTTATTDSRSSRGSRSSRSETRSDGVVVESATAGTRAPLRGSDAGSADDVQRLHELAVAAERDPSRRGALAEAASRLREAPIRVTVTPRQNRVIVRTSDARALAEIRTLIQRMDVPTAIVLLEVRVLSLDLDEGETSFFEYQWGNARTAGGFTLGDIAQRTAPAIGPGGTGLRAGDLSFQFVDERFGARMQILEKDGRIRTLATPVLLTANNEVGRLFVGREVPLNRSFTGGQVINGENAVTTTPGSTAIEFRRVGTTLLVTPSINADRTVTLRIVQESSDVNSTASVLVPTETGFAPQDLNVVSKQSVSGTIVAKSEMAVAFGGLIEKGRVKEVQQVPVLGSVPLLGLLFRRDVDRETRREIVVVVRPHVMSTPAEAEGLSRRLLEDLSKDAGAIPATPADPEPPRRVEKE